MASRYPPSTDQTAFEFLTDEQAAEVEAITAYIIPTDDVAGAREARVVNFLDRTIADGVFFPWLKNVSLEALNELQAKVREKFPSADYFSRLSPDQQLVVLSDFESWEFFEFFRSVTVFGYLTDPSYGGNYGRSGWAAVAFEDRFAYQPPFGFYDRDQHGSEGSASRDVGS